MAKLHNFFYFCKGVGKFFLKNTDVSLHENEKVCTFAQ